MCGGIVLLLLAVPTPNTLPLFCAPSVHLSSMDTHGSFLPSPFCMPLLLQVFDCVHVEGEGSYLRAEMEVRCYEGGHVYAMVGASIGTSIYSCCYCCCSFAAATFVNAAVAVAVAAAAAAAAAAPFCCSYFCHCCCCCRCCCFACHSYEPHTLMA